MAALADRSKRWHIVLRCIICGPLGLLLFSVVKLRSVVAKKMSQPIITEIGHPCSLILSLDKPRALRDFGTPVWKAVYRMTAN